MAGQRKKTRVTDAIEKLYTGKAGEHLVMAHLLKRGYVAMSATVDTGVDVIAHARHDPDRIVKFQVKTTTINDISLRFENTRLEEFWTDHINLCVVFWQSIEPAAVVFPAGLIHMMTTGGFENSRAPIRRGSTHTSFRVRMLEDGTVYVRNKSQIYTQMVNRFDLADDIGADTYRIPGYAIWSDDPKRVIDFDFDDGV